MAKVSISWGSQSEWSYSSYKIIENQLMIFDEQVALKAVDFINVDEDTGSLCANVSNKIVL